MVYTVLGNITLNLKPRDAGPHGVEYGNIKLYLSLSSDYERTNFGVTGNVSIDMSLDSSDCQVKVLQPNTSFSPRTVAGDLTVSLEPSSFIFITSKEAVEFYESNSFVDDTTNSGGIVTVNKLADTNDANILTNFSYMSKNYPFLGVSRPRKIFAKNVSGFPLRYLHIGVEYPLLALNDVNLVTIGTESDTYGTGKYGWTSTGIVEDDIPVGVLTDEAIIEVTYKAYANSVIWAGQLVKLSNGFGYSVYCVVSSVTAVDGQTTLIKLNSLTEIKTAFTGGETLLVGLRSVATVAIDEYVPIWLMNIIPFNAQAVTNQRVRLIAQGVI